jgi:hypothetical protein
LAHRRDEWDMLRDTNQGMLANIRAANIHLLSVAYQLKVCWNCILVDLVETAELSFGYFPPFCQA